MPIGFRYSTTHACGGICHQAVGAPHRHAGDANLTKGRSMNARNRLAAGATALVMSAGLMTLMTVTGTALGPRARLLELTRRGHASDGGQSLWSRQRKLRRCRDVCDDHALPLKSSFDERPALRDRQCRGGHRLGSLGRGLPTLGRCAGGSERLIALCVDVSAIGSASDLRSAGHRVGRIRSAGLPWRV
jgi:hypothetical protein